MALTIQTISTHFFLNISVNCYLIKTDSGYILIDTGMPASRNEIERALARAGCHRGDLKLILLTHGDIDHCGNAAYFRLTFETRVAMHADDSGMVEQGDMFSNRKRPNRFIRALFGYLFSLKKTDRFEPDVYLYEGYNLSDYGLDARVICIPGHSKGSIGVLTAESDFFCGDLLGNLRQPEPWSIIDDEVAATNSVRKLKSLKLRTVYPGHGKSFSIEQCAALAQ